MPAGLIRTPDLLVGVSENVEERGVLGLVCAAEERGEIGFGLSVDSFDGGLWTGIGGIEGAGVEGRARASTSIRQPESAAGSREGLACGVRGNAIGTNESVRGGQGRGFMLI